MSEIKVGEYIRTERGKIRKILKLDMREFEEFGNIIYETNDEDFYKEEIVKHSSNIIDLIEVGDYVNGIKIDLIEGKTLWHNAYDMADAEMYHNEDIKSVITKEQFAESEYKVNE